MSKFWFVVGSVWAGVAVALGAFGAHGLRARVEPALLAAWETGVRYHLVHALALLAVALATARWPDARVDLAGWLFLVGSLLFSGSLYAMALGAPRGLGAVTPLGGAAMIVGWAVLAVAIGRAG